MLTASLLDRLLLEAHFLRVHVHLLQQNLAVPAHIAVVLVFAFDTARSMLRREALENRRDRDKPGQALVRYVQLNRQCSEEEAYQRLAAFVKKHGSLGDQGLIENMLAQERERLLAIAQELLVSDPDEIDEI